MVFRCRSQGIQTAHSCLRALFPVPRCCFPNRPPGLSRPTPSSLGGPTPTEPFGGFAEFPRDFQAMRLKKRHCARSGATCVQRVCSTSQSSQRHPERDAHLCNADVQVIYGGCLLRVLWRIAALSMSLRPRKKMCSSFGGNIGAPLPRPDVGHALAWPSRVPATGKLDQACAGDANVWRQSESVRRAPSTPRAPPDGGLSSAPTMA